MSSSFSANSGSWLSLKVLDQMRLQAVGVPDAPHAGLADARRCRHRARAPVRGVGRFLMRGHLHDLLHAAIGDGACSARSRCVLLQSGDAAFQKALAPPRRLLRRDAHPPRDLLVLQTLGGQQHDPRPLHHTRRRRALSRQTLQRSSLLELSSIGGAVRILSSSTVWTHPLNNRYYL